MLQFESIASMKSEILPFDEQSYFLSQSIQSMEENFLQMLGEFMWLFFIEIKL